jgi:hypothetical protein
MAVRKLESGALDGLIAAVLDTEVTDIEISIATPSALNI